MSVTGSPRLISLFSRVPALCRIFIFADPELLSEAICNALVTDTEAAQVSQSPRACMCYVVIHAMQASLGEGCDVSGLKRSLQVTGTTSAASHMVFQWSCSCWACQSRERIFGKWGDPSAPHCRFPSPVAPPVTCKAGLQAELVLKEKILPK